MAKLKPCPFCKGGNINAVDCGTGVFSANSYVECKDCHAFIFGETYEKAIAAWNQRAESTCKLEYVEGWTGGTSRAVKCTSCGEMSDSSVFGMKYCPQCGLEAVD